MRYLTDFADQAVVLPMVLAIAVMLAIQGWRRGASVWLGVVLATFSVMLAMKLVCLGCTPVFGPADIRSPSGHVAAATVIAGGLAALHTQRRAGILAVGLFAAVVIGISRLVLGMHSLPEVTLGAMVGLGGAVTLLSLAGPPPPNLRPGRLLAVAAVVATIFHGLHLPAEAAIRHAAFRTVHLLAVCDPQHPLAALALPESAHAD
jgi:membrane-associated phospholipid phosphatase